MDLPDIFPQSIPLGTVLVVDDDAVVRRVTQLLLSDAGYRVFEAEDGREGLDVLEEHGPVDLVVTDIVMPRLDGVAFAETLRREHPDQSVLYMSAHPAEVMVQYNAVDLTVPFLAKPYTRSQLLSKVALAIKSSRSSSRP